MTAETYNQVFTLHGVIMVFLFIIPSIPAALGNFFLPIMIGAKDVAFPRLNMASFYLWILGAVLTLVAIFKQGCGYRMDVLHPVQHRVSDLGDMDGSWNLCSGDSHRYLPG